MRFLLLQDHLLKRKVINIPLNVCVYDFFLLVPLELMSRVEENFYKAGQNVDSFENMSFN